MGFKTTALLTTASVLVASAPAFATTFSFEKSYPNGQDRAGDVSFIETSYQNDNGLFKWSATFEEVDGILPDGAWLVVNDGPNPKQHDGEFAIYYLDGTEDIVSIFEYNGANDSNSLDSPGNFLGSTGLTVEEGTGSKTFSFEFDTDGINALTDIGPDWKGTSFNDRIGIWFHGVKDLETAYKLDESGERTNELLQFNYDRVNQSWYDIGHQKATAVPEPATVAAMGLFALAGVVVKRKKQVA